MRSTSSGLVWLLVPAMVLVDLAVLAAGMGVKGFPHPVLVLAWALALSQMSLTAIWLVWGSGWLPIRAACAVFVLTCWSRGLADLADALGVSEWVALNGLHLVLTGAVVAIAPPRLGWTVAWPARCREKALCAQSTGAEDSAGVGQSPRAHEASTPAAGRYQFSILYMLAWMTSLAVILGLLKVAVREPRAVLEVMAAPHAWLFAGLRAVVAGVVLSIVLGRRRLVLKLVCLLVIEALSCSVLAPPALSDSIWGPMLHLGEAMLLAGCLAVLRIDGVRLVPRAEQATADEQSA